MFLFCAFSVEFLYDHKSIRRHFVVQSQERHMQRCCGTFPWHGSTIVKCVVVWWNRFFNSQFNVHWDMQVCVCERMFHIPDKKRLIDITVCSSVPLRCHKFFWLIDFFILNMKIMVKKQMNNKIKLLTFQYLKKNSIYMYNKE